MTMIGTPGLLLLPILTLGSAAFVAITPQPILLGLAAALSFAG